MNWEPITLEELKELGRRINPEFVVADSEPELYGELNTKYPHTEWALLKSPQWIGDKLVAFVVKPRAE